MKTLTIATLLLSTAMSTVAYAETTDDTILVTARKTEERLQDVPVSVRVFGEEELRSRNAVNVSALPGFSSRIASIQSEALLLSVHGQTQTDPTINVDGAVGVYVDGVYVARSYGLNNNLLDVKNIQVLSGPQGTLFGRNSTGGAIIINTNDPKLNVFEGNAEFTYGRFNELQETAVLNLPINDMVAVRFAANKYDRDGIYTETTSGEKLQFKDSVNVRGKILYQPTDAIRSVLSAEYYDLTSTADARLRVFGWPNTVFATNGVLPPSDTVTNTEATPSELTFRSISFDTDIGDLKVVGGWRRSNGYQNNDLDGSAGAYLHMRTNFDIEQFTVESNYNGNLGDLKYIAGAFYFLEKGDDDTYTRANLGAENLDWNYYGNNQSYGAFLNASYPIGKVTVNAGIRYTNDRKSATTANYLRTTTGAPIRCVFSTASLSNGCSLNYRQTFENVSWTAGVDYKPTDSTLIYAKVSTGFKSGGINARGTDPNTNAPISPEKLIEYQVGVKGEVGPITYSVAGFYNRGKDVQVSIFYPVPVTTNVIRNAAETEAWGGEASVSARVTDRLTVKANGILVNPNYINFINPRTGANLSNNQFNMVIRKQVSLDATYDAGFAKFNANYVWTDTYSNTAQDLNYLVATYGVATGTNAFNSAQVPENSNLNLRVDVPVTNNLDVSLWGRNVTNSRYIKYVLMSERSWVGGSMNDPATYGVTVKARF